MWHDLEDKGPGAVGGNHLNELNDPNNPNDTSL